MTFLDIDPSDKKTDVAVDVRLGEDVTASALVGHVRSRFKTAEDGRYSDEQRWLKAYKNYRGLSNNENAEKMRGSERSNVIFYLQINDSQSWLKQLLIPKECRNLLICRHHRNSRYKVRWVFPAITWNYFRGQPKLPSQRKIL